MLISEIISEVINEVGGDASDTGLTAKMLIFAKGALRRFPLFTKSRLITVVSYATLQSGQYYLTTPTYFTNEKAIWYEDSGNRKDIFKKDDDKFRELFNSQASGTPEYYHIVNNVIEFDKCASQNMVIYVEHEGEVDDVTAASDFFGSTDMLEILKDGIKATYYSDYVENPSKGSEKLSLFKLGLDKLEERHMIQTCGGHIGG